MTNVTKLWLRVIFAGGFTFCAARITMAMAMINGPLHAQAWETSPSITISENYDVILFAGLAGGPTFSSDSASDEGSERSLLNGAIWDADALFWMSSITVSPGLHDQRYPSVEQLYNVLLLNDGDQNYGLESIGDRMGGCDFSPEACQDAGLASSNGAESATGISKPTAILLLVIGFIGLMRARGRPIP
jgi:hypothetical protein